MNNFVRIYCSDYIDLFKVRRIFYVFDDKDQICLQVDYLTAEMAISFHIGKVNFRIECCQGRNARFVFPPGR